METGTSRMDDLKDFAAGCAGGCAGVTVGHPIDTVKVRLQTQNLLKPVYNGTTHCFASIIKKESVFGLYKGLASPLYFQAGINAVIFGVQGNVQRRLSNPDSIRSHIVAGSTAGFAQAFIVCPMELAKIRMQIQGEGESRIKYQQTRHYKGPIDCLLKIFRAEGIPGVYRGFGLTLAREIPAFGVYFGSYEYICRRFHCKGPAQDISPTLLLAGGTAGVLSWLCNYPVDLIKSKIQGDVARKYSGFWDCTVKSYRESGLRFFVRGLQPTLLRAFVVNAATFMAYEMSLRAMGAGQRGGDF